MKIIFGMPEILVIFSFFIFSQSWGFGVTAFCLGVMGRSFGYLVDFAMKKEQQEESEQAIENLAIAWKNLFKLNKDE